MGFSALIERSTRGFTGRQWVFGEIDGWLADPDGPRHFIITGEPGIGKTAIAARLTQIRDLAAVHFCVARQANTFDPLTFTRSLSCQLARTDGFALGILKNSEARIEAQQDIRQLHGQAINVQIQTLVVNAPSATIAFNRTVAEPLRNLYGDGFDQQLVILVDSLDEAVQFRGQETIVDLLANAGGLPSRVRFVLTSRPASGVLRHFEQLDKRHLELDAGGAENRQDVRNYIHHRLETSQVLHNRMAEQEVTSEEFVERVTDASEGNFLYLVWLLRGIAEGAQSLDDLEALPEGLDGIYREFLRTRPVGRDLQHWEEVYRPLLGVLSVAQEPLTTGQLSHFTGLAQQAVRDVLLDVQQFLDLVGFEMGRYRLYHQSAIDFLTNEVQAQEFWIDTQLHHQRIADYYVDKYDHKWDSCSEVYGLQYLAVHLMGADQSQYLCRLVLDADWLAAKSRYDVSRRSYVSDVDMAFAEAARRGSPGWPRLAANSLIRASLTAIASYLPVEAYEALVRLDRGQEALQRARLIADPTRRRESLRIIRKSAEELTKTNLAKEADEEMTGLPPPEANHQSKGDDWLIDFVEQVGTERALRARLRGQVAPDPDRSRAAESYLEVAEAAISLGQFKEARKLLLDCLHLLGETWDHDRHRLITRIASFLFEVGHEADLGHLIDLAQDIELEHYRVLAVSELALICSNASDFALAKRSLAIAVSEIRKAKRRSTLQFEMSKVALAMSRLGDHRASKWLGEAIDLAGRPTQAAWRWEEKEAWARVAGSLASVGLCNEALDLARQIGPEEFTEERILVELALQDRWDDARQLAQDMHPIVRKRGLTTAASILAQRNRLDRQRHHTVITKLEEDLSTNGQPRDQIVRLKQLINITLLVQDESEAQAYLVQMMDLVDEVGARQKAEAIGDALCSAVRLADVQVVRRLARSALDLPRDERHHSRSNAIANAVRALADLGEVEEAWSLSQRIDEDWKRLETYVYVCELAEEQGQSTKAILARTLAFARGVENVGFVPTYWGKLAVLSHRLDREDDMEDCIDWAIEGAYAIEPSHEIGFNIINSGNVAQSLYELGLSDAAEEMLKFGIDQSHRALQSTEVLLILSQALARIEAESLWPDVVRAAQSLEEPVQRARALLEITPWIAHSGSLDYAVEILPLVLGAIQDAGGNLYSLLGFGALLREILETEGQSLDYLVVDIFQDVRLLDRPRTLTAIAALLPVFAIVDPTLPRVTWNSVEHIEDLLNPRRSRGSATADG